VTWGGGEGGRRGGEGDYRIIYIETYIRGQLIKC